VILTQERYLQTLMIVDLAKYKQNKKQKQEAIQAGETPLRWLKRVFGIGVIPVNDGRGLTAFKAYDLQSIKTYIYAKDIEAIKILVFGDVWYLS
jgi:hypothetical protein